MTRKQTLLIALMCVVAAILAALMLWRPPAAPGNEEHAGHADSHGHDDRHAQEEAGVASESAGESAREPEGVAMSEAQIRANGIAVGSAGPASIRERLHLPAQIKVNAERTVALAAPAPGIAESVLVSVGTPVRKGQPLVVIASPTVAQWRAEYGSARARLELAQATYRREKALWEEGVSARQDLDAASSALKEAEFASQAARQRLDALGLSGSGASSASATIRAPLDGVVVEKPVVAGQAVDERGALLTIADLAEVWVEAAVPADSLAQVASGMPAEISVNALAQPLAAKVAFVGPLLGEATRMATARVVLPNPQRRLRPGMLATLDLLGEGAQVPVTVASEAVQTVHERSVVFVRTASGFRPQTVTLGRSDGKRTEIASGLAAGARYAAAGSFLLKAELGKSDAEHGH